MEVFWIYCLIDEYSTLLINHFTCFKHIHSSHNTHAFQQNTHTSYHKIETEQIHNFLVNAIKIGISLIYQYSCYSLVIFLIVAATSFAIAFSFILYYCRLRRGRNQYIPNENVAHSKQLCCVCQIATNRNCCLLILISCN